MNAHQWLILDNQQIGYPQYALTSRHYSSRRMVERAFHTDQEAKVMFRIIAPLKRSKVSGELAEMITKHERHMVP